MMISDARITEIKVKRGKRRIHVFLNGRSVSTIRVRRGHSVESHIQKYIKCNIPKKLTRNNEISYTLTNDAEGNPCEVRFTSTQFDSKGMTPVCPIPRRL